MGVGVVGSAPYTCAHVHMHTHTNAHVVNMIISCKWMPPLGESLGIPYDVIRACVCMCACVWGAPSHHPHPHPPTPRGTPRISQNSIALELIEIFQFRLKI